MARHNVPSGGPWEERVGYSRAVRVGPHVWVAGTTAMTPGGLVGSGDAYAQAKQALRTIAEALEQAGARLDDVVRTRMFVTDLGDWEAVARAHAEAFGAVRPAATMVEVSRLMTQEMLVEIEVEAFVDR
jgi:enamine deaminase RidA (YjgF/YER057c/UK114 family)